MALLIRLLRELDFSVEVVTSGGRSLVIAEMSFEEPLTFSANEDGIAVELTEGSIYYNYSRLRIRMEASGDTFDFEGVHMGMIGDSGDYVFQLVFSFDGVQHIPRDILNMIREEEGEDEW